jgi:hypothetical protein
MQDSYAVEIFDEVIRIMNNSLIFWLTDSNNINRPHIFDNVFRLFHEQVYPVKTFKVNGNI